MTVLLILIPVALLLGLIGLGGFLWALKSGQFDDLEGAAHRILLDDESELKPSKLTDESGQSPETQENSEKVAN